ncbi:DUF4231 domain-containing protein [Mycoplasma sp. 'Moose RK']|uniref:DUF4231 domain-containing protein n=1 Tax=Mycoplasma sp. 'Moose RK' TaxID=2780095 RepID=UPI0018C33F88|nr:DUF4231 domain-containing protein [Mycoplasma sp. 'Moose RK']MBG0730889.1 DUF4231 domain-containing protein [Mycoplasma sp. 'Moose RK']
MIIKNTRLDEDSYVFAKFLYRKTFIKAYFFQFLFWTVSIFSIIFAFITTLMGIFKLAAPKISTFDGFDELFTSIDKNGAKVDQWPIFVLWINLSITIINALFALFLVKPRWIRNQQVNDFLKIELILFETKSGKYAKSENLQITLFDAICKFLGCLSALKDKLEPENSMENQGDQDE